MIIYIFFTRWSFVYFTGLAGNIPACAVMFCGAQHTFQKHVPPIFLTLYLQYHKFNLKNLLILQWSSIYFLPVFENIDKGNNSKRDKNQTTEQYILLQILYEECIYIAMSIYKCSSIFQGLLHDVSNITFSTVIETKINR